MSRPKPRTNIFAGTDAATPPATETPDTTPPAPRPQAEPTEQAKPHATDPAKPKYRHKMSFYIDRDLADQVRGAIIHTMAHGEARSLTDFANKAFTDELARLQNKYNGGEAFPPITELPQGRPLGR